MRRKKFKSYWTGTETFNAIDNPKWSGVLEALQRSESLLERTWMMDEKAAPR